MLTTNLESVEFVVTISKLWICDFTLAQWYALKLSVCIFNLTEYLGLESMKDLLQVEWLYIIPLFFQDYMQNLDQCIKNLMTVGYSIST